MAPFRWRQCARAAWRYFPLSMEGTDIRMSNRPKTRTVSWEIVRYDPCKQFSQKRSVDQ